MKFFNFHNDQTFHFFLWVMHSGKVSVDALIGRSWRRIAAGEDGADDLQAQGVSPLGCLPKSLARVLKDVLDDATNGLYLPFKLAFGTVDEEEGAGEFDDPVYFRDESVNTLLFPILISALRGIDFSRVAEAILREKGQWAPDHHES